MASPFINKFTGKGYDWPIALLVISVFTKEIATRSLVGVDFDFIAYPFAIFYFIWAFDKMIKSGFLPYRFFLYIIVSSVFSILLLNLNFDGFLKQIIPILIIFSINFYLIRKGNHIHIFELYVRIAYWTAVFGIFQVILSLAGIQILIKEPGRLDSIAYEPSHYAAILVPALVYALFNYKRYTRQFYVMLVALILTLNITGYLVFLLTVSLAFINPLYIAISIPVLYFVIFGFFQGFNQNFQRRIDDTLAVFTGSKNVLGLFVNANGTTVSFYSNLMAAKYAVSQSPITGSGLGGHEQMYYRYFDNSIFRFNYFYGLNAKSGHSLSVRILSEFGILGFLLYWFVIIRSLILLDNGIFKSISLACFSHFLCKTLKLGGYIDYGTPFFFAMLLINAWEYRRLIKSTANRKSANKLSFA